MIFKLLLFIFINTKIQKNNDTCNRQPKNGTIFPKNGTKKIPLAVGGREFGNAARGARGACLDVCIIKVMRVVGRDVRSAELPIWQSIGGRVEGRFIARVVKDCIRAQPIARLIAA